VAQTIPLISVLLATNKIDEYLWVAVDSILAQTSTSFELLLIANGTDCNLVALELKARYSGHDNVTVVCTPIPQLAYALNLGLSIARADIIARMDADDIAVPDRLATQYSYLNTHQLDLVGSDIEIIDANGSSHGFRSYPRGNRIEQLLPYKNCFCHPSVMVKKSVLFKARGYNAGFNSEDYDLWLRLVRQGVRWDNIDRPLLRYRVYQSSAQGTRLAYAECLGLAVREFFLHMTFTRFVAMMGHAAKFLYKKMR
jgi:glycosyltransferase involved in cell wall biosynthesis